MNFDKEQVKKTVVKDSEKKTGSFETYITNISPIEDSANNLILPISFFRSSFKETINHYQIKVYMPKFVINENNDPKNFLNNKAFKANNVIQFTPDNISAAKKNYTDMMVAYAKQLITAYFPNENCRKRCLDLMKDSEYECSLLYTKYTDDPHISPYEGKTYYNGKVEGAEVRLFYVKGTEGNTYYYELDIEGTLTSKLCHFQNAVDQQVGIFWNKIINLVQETNTGQKGYIFLSYTKGKDNKWYLNPVSNLKSLVISVYSLVENDERRNVDREEAERKKVIAYYGVSAGRNWKGLNSINLRYRNSTGEFFDRIQFVFMSEPYNEIIQGNDTQESDQYRNPTYNPFIIMNKPQEEEDVNKLNNNKESYTDFPL